MAVTHTGASIDAFCEQFQTMTVTYDDHVLSIVMGREETPPMDYNMFTELGDLFDGVSQRDEVRVLVLSGIGRRFSVGGNVRRMAAGNDGDEWLSRGSAVSSVARMYRMMMAVDQPIIASVNGDAVGAGATIALHSDIILAADTARLGDPHVLRGLVASAGSYIWPLQMSLTIAKEYLLTGDLMPIAEAHRLGIVNHVYTAEELPERTRELAHRLAATAPHAVRWTKRLLNQPLVRQLTSGLDSGVAHEIITFKTEDHREGAQAFLERRPPRFTGR